jgi:hypothetical protein
VFYHGTFPGQARWPLHWSGRQIIVPVDYLQIAVDASHVGDGFDIAICGYELTVP